VSEWRREWLADERVVATAVQILDEQAKKTR
jgi:hypothetical protein